jgi:predicted GIY-YIG superfamily endonuclease
VHNGDMIPGHIYLIHFDKPMPDSNSRHYLGFSRDYRRRIAQHRANEGAHIMRRVNELGIPWRVVRVWRGTMDSESMFKRIGNYDLLCPCCNPSGFKNFPVSLESSRRILTLEKT